MKIIVCVKQVPSRDSTLRLEGDGARLNDSDLSFQTNEPDAYALEEALQLKEKLGGEVIVVSAGPSRVQQTIREALAKGADRGIHVETADKDNLDAFGIAQMLAEALKPEAADLVLTGLQSDDMGFAQTGVILAELLGFAHATIVMEIEPAIGAVRVKRELEDGWYQNVVLPLPALLTIQSGIKKLRYATLMGIKKAKTKEVKTVAISPAIAASFSGSLHPPEKSRASQIFSGEAKQAAHQLIEKLRFEARVL